MMQPQPAVCDDVTAFVDVVEVARFFIVLRNRATGAEHCFAYHHIQLGSSELGDCYMLVMPRWLADVEGIADAR